MNDRRTDDAETTLDTAVALKTGKHGKAAIVEIDHKRRAERLKVDGAEEHRHEPSDSEAVAPLRPGRRPWVWALLGVASLVGIGVGVAYYVYSLSYESTDDAFVDGHVVAVSPRVAGHVAKVYVTDNQWVHQGDLIAEPTPRFRGPFGGGAGRIDRSSGGPAVAIYRGRRY